MAQSLTSLAIESQTKSYIKLYIENDNKLKIEKEIMKLQEDIKNEKRNAESLAEKLTEATVNQKIINEEKQRESFRIGIIIIIINII